MNQAKHLIQLFLLSIILHTVACTGTQKQDGGTVTETLPNIVLLMGDDHGWDEVGYNGHPFVKTPVLDEMASTGIRFDHFYAAHPTCSPTRGSFLTGRHPNRYGTFAPGWSIRPEEITLAHILKEAGYATAHFGKWHVGPVKKESPTNPGAMGFDEWLSHDNFFDINPIFSRNGEEPQMYEGESSEVVVEEAIKFIKTSKKQNKPFLTVVWFGSPHEPYSSLPEDVALYANLNLPDTIANRKMRLTSNETGNQIYLPLKEILPERYAEITAMDRAIGKLRTFLKDNNLRENTLIFYCGDNGTSSDAGHVGITLREQKASFYDGGIRVPCVMEWPALVKGHKVMPVFSSTSDLLPTIAEIIKQPLPGRPVDGISLLPFLKDTETKREKPLYFWQFQQSVVFNKSSIPYIDPVLQEGTTPLLKKMDGKFTRDFKNYKYIHTSEGDFAGQRAITQAPYKLVVVSKGQEKEILELYNIMKDPTEKANIANDYPEIVEKLKTELRKWQESVLNSLAGADYN